MKSNILILSLPRSGSSVLANLIASAGFQNYTSNNSKLLSPSKFNKDGYFEDTFITLLNDQLIRLCYSLEHSFLFTPRFEMFKKIALKNSGNFKHDMVDVYMPKDYKNKIKEYSGCEWDVWGLTRTEEGQKWHKCYSRYGIDTGEKIIKQLKKTIIRIKSKENIIIKDPRLAFVAPLYNFNNFKVIYIKRKKKDIIKSMRNHYGNNLFTKNFLPDTEICSNHFNYKIGYQSFNYYYNNYNKIILDYLKNKNSLIIEYEKLYDYKTQKVLNDFIESEINFKILN